MLPEWERIQSSPKYEDRPAKNSKIVSIFKNLKFVIEVMVFKKKVLRKEVD